MGLEDFAGVQQERQVEQVQCKKDAAVQRRQVELQECENDLALAQLEDEEVRHEQEVAVARLQEGLARQQTQLSDTLEALPGSHQTTEKAVEQTQHELQVAAAAQGVGEDAEEKSENTQLEKEPVKRELQAEVQRVQAELARTWMDLQKCRADLVVAENELTQKDVDVQVLQKELQTCKEDRARLRREKEQLEREKKEDLAKVPTPFSDTSRKKEKEVASRRAREELATVRGSTPVVGQTCHIQLADGTWTSVCLPSHWIAQGVDVLRQVRQRASKGDPGNSCFSLLCVLAPEPRLTFEMVTQHIPKQEILENFTGLLRDSASHFGDWMSAFPHSSCNSLRDQIEVCEAYHIENVSLYKAYERRCKSLQLKHLAHGIVPEPISPDPNPALTELAQLMGLQMLAPNEHLLFHGTSSHGAQQIALEGFDIRRASGGLYGKGAYFAAQSFCDQYGGWGSGLHTVVIARVALGDPYYCRHTDPSLVRPPSKIPGGPCCDSVIAQPGSMPGHYAGHQNHAEFVVFQQEQVYPEYILKYRIRTP